MDTRRNIIYVVVYARQSYNYDKAINPPGTDIMQKILQKVISIPLDLDELISTFNARHSPWYSTIESDTWIEY